MDALTVSEASNEIKRCWRCKEEKDRSLFYNAKAKKDGKSSECKECCKARIKADYRDQWPKHLEAQKRWRESNPETYRKSYRNYRLKYAYGITIEEYDALYSAQGEKCAICGVAENIWKNRAANLCVDHDHVTGKVRGLLCHPCNTGLGALGDSIPNLKTAIDYLERSN